MGEHVPGSMDIRAQEKTFAGFIKSLVWSSAIIVVVLVFLALAGG